MAGDTEAREVDAVGDRRAPGRPRDEYTVIVCWYIMFCASTTPCPDATTDFGEIVPPMLRTSWRRVVSDGG